ncbi:putative integral membrane protein (TIGR00698 family) [Desulfofundulus luciae]|uniref:Integral membrane protein (TIGR00698 family) n=1 Tax=Desulfofundulus luciae TaxID=74702 RepID=A0ABU0AZA4_9FIRM|nr:putative sulfate exporter family transporter [Desulfofundulus luciae]MDQ0285354.1 putative integral membrane protein (TIGR00698 family) [Desulfofundulus luciae]
MGKIIIFAKTIPGILLMLAIAFLARGGGDLGLPWWPGLESLLAGSPLARRVFIDILHLNHILISIILGMLVGNLLGIPRWAAAGIRTSSLFIKIGVILLGSLYSVMDLAALGSTAAIIIVCFIVFMLLFTVWLGNRVGMDPAGAATLAAGTAVCGVSAILATAPAVRARNTDVVYSIATILFFGLISLFVFPVVGTLAGLSPHQFGVWAGTGIMNSGQVLAVCLTFDPGTVTHPSVSLKTGEIYNLTRVIFLPFVVLFLALFASRYFTVEDEVSINTGLWSRFPVFVLGFLTMVLLTSFGFLGPTSPPSRELTIIRHLYSWFFAIGLAGQGMRISLAELRRAGSKPLLVGTVAAFLKALLALIVVILFVPREP